ncbi:MAG: flavin-dependent oxidoreductase [Pseudomonadota bacterium]
MDDPILIVGGGIGGLTLALSLHQAGLPCRVFESAPEIAPLGVGINLLPHAMREMSELGMQDALLRAGVETRELCFFNRFGQHIRTEPRGRFAGYDWPQVSIHRGDLQMALLEAVRARVGADRVVTGRQCVRVEQDAAGVRVLFEDGSEARGSAAVGCDGIHSAIRAQLHPDEGPPVYRGIHMWRGVTRTRPFLSGASMAIAGWLDVGKLVVYPIRDDIDGQGTQLVNWIAEVQTERTAVAQDWGLAGRLEDFHPLYADRRHDWLDLAALIREADTVLEYPMVDREPLPFWTQGRVTLLGDAAHPMYPRGSNGAGQAILDARTLAGCLRRGPGLPEALKEYEDKRLKKSYEVVVANRSVGPDAILRTVHERTHDRPFERIEDVIGADEMTAMAENYQRIAGFERDALRQRAALV